MTMTGTIMTDWKSLSPAQRTDAIKPLIAEYKSASQIASRFIRCTRSSVISHCHRYGVKLSNGSPATMKAKAPAKQRPVRPIRPTPPKPVGNTASKPLPPPPPRPSPITALPFLDALDKHVCKWPLWDQFNANAKCCGAERAASGPYCAFHAALSIGRGTEGERTAVRILERTA